VIVFWLIVVVMVAVAIALILPALSGGTRVSGVARKQLNVSLHKQRLVELEAELRDGVLSQDQFEAARAELQRELLRDVGGDDEAPTAPASRQLLWPAATAVVVPALAIGLYVWLGEIGYVGRSPATLAQSSQQSAEMHSIEQMVSKLSARLQREPGDVDGWVLLGRSYVVLQRYEEAAQAYARAYQLKSDDPQLLADYAEVVAMANGNRLDGQPTTLAMQALALQPNNPKALWIAGVAALQRGEREVGLAYLQRLQKQLPPDSEAFGVVQNFLAQVMGAPPASAAATPAKPPASSAPPPTAAADTRLEVNVTLDPALAARAAPDDTVFIFAQAAQGPRMPLAIMRSRVQALPTTVTLDDSMAMTPTMRLSQFRQVIVGARVSKSGNATPQAGDLEGYSGTISLDTTQSLSININRVVP
jgi:cytochrome c-type biogenesis protein CcmH